MHDSWLLYHSAWFLLFSGIRSLLAHPLQSVDWLGFWVICQGCAEREQSDPEWEGVDNKSGGTTLASACVLCLDLLSRVWLRISGGRNCCQECRRGVVYRLIGVKMDIKDVNDFNLWTKELGCNYWSTYTKSRIEGVPVTSLHRDPIGVDNRSLGAKN